MDFILGIVAALIASEFWDVFGWASRRLVSWAAFHKYVPRNYAELKAEEFQYHIDLCPGQLFKFTTALYFVLWAILTSRVVPPVTEPVVEWSPTSLAINVSRQETSYSRHPNSREAHQEWRDLRGKIKQIAGEICVESRSWRRNIRKLRKITGDQRWDTIKMNLEMLDEIRDSSQSSAFIFPSVIASCVSGWVHHGYVITDSTLMKYREAAQAAGNDVRKLADGFLNSINSIKISGSR